MLTHALVRRARGAEAQTVQWERSASGRARRQLQARRGASGRASGGAKRRLEMPERRIARCL
eukprot:5526409-Alexandrium_andersonii.AAC.1